MIKFQTMKIKEYLNGTDVKCQLANLKQITFEVTDACNLKCAYCGYGKFYNDYDQRENKMFPVEKAYRLLDYLNEFWNSNMNISSFRDVVISFYGGEPLLNMSLIQEIVKYVAKLKCPSRAFSFSMTTNAILLDKYMDFLANHKFRLLISLDGSAWNTAYRVDKAGSPAYERIVANVNLLR